MNLHLPTLNDWSSDFSCIPKGVPVLLYNRDWIDADFCPEGVIEGYWDEGMFPGWIGAVWNPSSDQWDATEVFPTHWVAMPSGPT